MNFTEADIQNYMKEYGCTYAKAYSAVEKKSVGLPVEDFGGEGSGHHGHGGRPGEIGGSGEGSAGKEKDALPSNIIQKQTPKFAVDFVNEHKTIVNMKKALKSRTDEHLKTAYGFLSKHEDSGSEFVKDLIDKELNTRERKQ